MAPIPFFRCAKCHKEFDRHDDAAGCERSHAKVKRARSKQFTVGAYPYTVEVTFDDGNTKIYILEDMIHTLR